MGIFSFTKRIKYKDFTAINVDMHSHLIPGVDDGAKEVADSIQLISGLKELGYQTLYTTPHTLQDIHPNTHETLKKGYATLEGKLPQGINLQLSSEYYMDEQFINQLNEGTLLPMPGNRLLMEFSQISKPYDLEEVMFNLRIKGFQVVLAHPERYLFFHKHFDYYSRLKEMGLELQVNALSLTDHYGKGIRAIAEKLIEKDMIDFFGTDIHHIRHLPALKHVPESKFFTRLVDSGLLKNNTLNS
ncbi:tyrosine-protein phosphatase [Pedobacter antarcticus]|uniref:tyrosine-protein phosphatase n=1 Tax=Pedobacter antarcticus TaxID=34086 RepID=UPI00088A013F|nr:CpsB/CapC family capsule biosynthesis tyrosine phosphatase [Pedobacter antarcticus]SDM17473.1 Tyrosine-protein phosphatase YwqE [Pedobacter antarcticus]